MECSPDDTILETERLILRFQRAGDIGFLVDLWSDARAMEYLGGVRDREYLIGEFTKVAENPRAETYDLWPVTLRENGSPVGYAGFVPKEIEGVPRIELVYVVHPDYWGRGYATEIARALADYGRNVLGAETLTALIEPENLASKRVAERSGMRRVKSIIRPDGKVKDLYVLGKKFE